MTNNIDRRKQPILRILTVGLFLLLICIAVCGVLVALLKKTYSNQMINDFHEQHISYGEKLNSDINDLVGSVTKTAETLENAGNEFSEELIYASLDANNNKEQLVSVAFVTMYNAVYCNDRTIKTEDYIKLAGTEVDVKLYDKSDDMVHSMVVTGSDEETKMLVSYTPVYRNKSFKGFVVATINLQDVFDSSWFDYFTSMGECDLVDTKGDILALSGVTHISKNVGGNLFKNLLAYTHKGKSTLRTIKGAIADGKGGNQILKTKNGYSLLVSVTPIESVNKVYFVSCFDDNVVDDRIQPLIFRCAVACMIICFIMIIIIIYVWSTSKNANITIEKLAFDDPITHGKNINYFKDFVSNTMAVFKETPFVIYRYDIVNFRYINEAYGHERADSLLGACIRAFEEIFSEKELCVRMDADQFLALIDNNQNVTNNLKKYNAKVNESARGLGIKFPIKFKMGIYQIRKHDHEVDRMIDRANVARKTLSGDEKEATAIYSDKIVNDMRKVERIESEMQRALATEEFKLNLQPKFDIITNSICGAEALVRWKRNDGTVVYPDEFIPVFENNGFIEKLDFYMLEKVCEYLRKMIDEGKTIYPVSVNQSRVLFHSQDYVANVDKILKKYDIPKGYVELEVTETVFENERELMVNTMSQLKASGVRFAMDDFGSGYSSLNMLKDIPFDIIKLDREFFSESVTSQKSLWILQKIIEMINLLGLELVCEGVENEQQRDLLKQIGCRIVQGYLYSKPIELEEFVSKYNTARY